MSINYKLIGERIKIKRKEARLTQEQLSEKLSVTVGYISQIERGITKPNLEMLSEICVILNCTLPYLTDGVITERRDYLNEEIINKFARLNDKNKVLILGIIDLLSENE